MKIIIIGAGFTGLTAAYRLLQDGHEVVVVERSQELGGLATGYRHKSWKWKAEEAYHHLFTNDLAAINLAKEIGQKLRVITPKTGVLLRGDIYPLDTPLALLKFPYLSWMDKIRTGLSIAYLKIVNYSGWMEGRYATAWIKKHMGENSYRIVWEPLFRGKFHDQADSVMLPWFWARIKKRTQSLMYPEGGFGAYLETLATAINERGGTIKLNSSVNKVRQGNDTQYKVTTSRGEYQANKILYTGSTNSFSNLFGRPIRPKRKVHKYLTAQIMVLRLKQAFLNQTYWLNVTDPGYPFLVLVDHTNFVSSQHYNDEHLVYIGNYLPVGHDLLRKSPAALFKYFDPFINKIDPGYRKHLIGYDVFTLPYAQAVVNTDYVSNMKQKGTGMPGVFMANIDSVYPWDRGVNYAIEQGELITAEMIQGIIAK